MPDDTDPISSTVAFLLKNFTLTFFFAGLIVSLIIIAVRRPDRHGIWHVLFTWFLIFSIGITYIYNGVFHIAFGDMAAASIGWENNGFQAEVGFASIGIGIVGLMAAPRRMPFSLKLAAMIGPACFLWGAAGAHIYDIIETGNLAPNNAGVILYTDILIPVIGFALWACAYASRNRSASTPRAHYGIGTGVTPSGASPAAPPSGAVSTQMPPV